MEYCTERLYNQFTHVCTARPDLLPSYRACCCLLPSDALLCCRHQYDPLTYLCVDTEDVVDDVSVSSTDLYIYILDAVPPVHVV